MHTPQVSYRSIYCLITRTTPDPSKCFCLFGFVWNCFNSKGHSTNKSLQKLFLRRWVPDVRHSVLAVCSTSCWSAFSSMATTVHLSSPTRACWKEARKRVKQLPSLDLSLLLYSFVSEKHVTEVGFYPKFLMPSVDLFFPFNFYFSWTLNFHTQFCVFPYICKYTIKYLSIHFSFCSSILKTPWFLHTSYLAVSLGPCYGHPGPCKRPLLISL